MKNIIIISLFIFILNSCSNSRTVYWCGDHACVSKKEKEAYFKKNMVIEKRVIDKKKKKNKSTLEVIIDDHSLNVDSNDKNLNIASKNNVETLELNKSEKKRRIKEEKELANQITIEDKRRIKAEKELVKQKRLEEKRRIKAEKELVKQKRLEKKRRIKEEKELIKLAKLEEKKINSNVKKDSKETEILVSTKIDTLNFSINEFDELVKEIINKNKEKPYPNLNDMPN